MVRDSRFTGSTPTDLADDALEGRVVTDLFTSAAHPLLFVSELARQDGLAYLGERGLTLLRGGLAHLQLAEQ